MLTINGSQFAGLVVVLSQRNRLVRVSSRMVVVNGPGLCPADTRSSSNIGPPRGAHGQVTVVSPVPAFVWSTHVFESVPTVLTSEE